MREKTNKLKYAPIIKNIIIACFIIHDQSFEYSNPLKNNIFTYKIQILPLY
jgi:hypothetical protein